MMSGASVKEPFLAIYVGRRCYHGVSLILVVVSCMGLGFRIVIYPLEVYIKMMITSSHNMSKLSAKLTLRAILRD